ncbi:MAG TPA: VanW family protein [Polyangiales bacterium]|nr:VanW family protein [Polyangiales bacterium]
MWVDVGHSRAAGWALRAALIAAILAGAMLLITPPFPDPEAHAAAPVRVDVAGERVELTRDVGEAAERIARDYLSGELSVRAGNAERRISRRALGARVDTAHLRDLLRAAADAHSPLRRVHAQALGQRPLQLPMPNDLDVAAASALVTQIKDITDVPALEPRIDPRARRVVPARQGAELDLFATLERIDAALRSGSRSVQAVIRAVPSKQSTRALEEIQLPAVMGEFETRYNRASLSQDRTHNLKLAAAKLDGFVLAPGQVFDFNAAVGDRTESTGFRAAPVIADGELVDGMGGGTCQVASTLHAAVLFAGLPVLTRTPHSRPSFYIKLGLDATVVYGAQNFRFKNDRAYPIVLGLSVDEGRVYASVHGLARDRSVVFIRHIDGITPFEERTSVDAKLPVGLRVLDQRGIPGFKVTRVRIIHDPATNQDVRERNTDSYPPTPQLWRVGIGGEARPGFERPRNDPHPEYVADEYLQMTQTERGTQDLLREPGRSGDYGWIERDGLVLRKP